MNKHNKYKIKTIIFQIVFYIIIQTYNPALCSLDYRSNEVSKILEAIIYFDTNIKSIN